MAVKSESVTWKLGDVFLDRRSELHVVAARILRQSDWAEDVLHDTYLKLSTCSREQVVLNPFGYCCQAVRNTALDHVRRRELEAHLILSSDDEEPPEMIDEREASSGIDERKLLQLIEATLSALPERAQLVFRLHRVEGKTQREIGRMVGVSATLVNFTLRDVTQALEPLRSAWG
jgi:RNA polymerase sigma-70 factor (ECF subfamily)